MENEILSSKKAVILKTIFIFYLLVAMKVAAQIPSFVWAKSITSTLGIVGDNLAVDAAGNSYMSGTFVGTVDFDPGPGVYNITSYENCCDDIFVLKLNAAGDFVWAKHIGGLNYDRNEGMCIDASGNVYLTGNFGGTPDFDPGPGVYNLVATSYSNMFICKLDVSGNFIFAKHIIGTGLYGTSDDITVDLAGNIYTTGNFSDTCDFDPGIGVYNLYGDTTGGIGQHGTIFINKLDVSGNFVWAKSLGNLSSFNEGLSVTTDGAGNVYTTGDFGGTGDFDPGAGIFNMTALGVGPNESNVFVSKLNSSGNFVWAKRMGYETAGASSIKIGPTGSVYTTGGFYLTGDFDPGPGIFNITSAGSSDIFVSALDASGNFLWAKGMGGTAKDEARSLSVDQYNNIYTTGSFDSSADFDPGAGTFSLSPHSGNRDVFVSKLDASGNFLNAGNMGGTGGDGGNSIASDNFGNAYTTGGFGGTADFDPGPNTYTFSTTTGNVGLFLSKLCTTPASPLYTTAAGNLNICSGNTTTLNVVSAGTANWYSTPTSTVVLATGSSFITPTLAIGSYTYYAEANACSANPSRTPVALTVNATPTITVNSPIICSSTSTVLTANGGTTYSWTPATNLSATTGAMVTANPTGTIIYTVTGTTNGCSGSKTSTVTVNATPTITVNSPTICSSTSTVLIASGGTTYSWTPGTNLSATTGSMVTANPTSTNIYTVTGTTNGCSGSKTSTVTVNAIPTLTVNSPTICSSTSTVLIASGGTTYSWTPATNLSATTGPTVTVNPTSTNIYTVTGTTNGCSGSKTSTVTVNATPTITVNSPTICSSTSTVLTASGGTTYSWTPATNLSATTGAMVTANPTSTNIYTVTGTTNGCSGAKTSMVTVNATPTINATTNNSIICVGQTATLTASGALTYTWNPGGAGTNITVSPTVTANYTVIGTSTNGCMNSSTFTQSVSTCTGIQQRATTNSGLNIYPNPFNNKITVVSDALGEKIQIFNALSSIVYSLRIENEKTEINLTEQPSGIYFIRIGTVSKKIIKE
jgi:hypothetical protein